MTSRGLPRSHQDTRAPGASEKARRLESKTSLALVAIASAAGAAVFPPGRFGPTSPLAAGSEGWLLLAGPWAALVAWALVYAELLRRVGGLPRRRALFWAALAHLPLLLGLALAGAVYGSPEAGRAYAFSPVGRQLFQPLARDYVIAAPLAVQAAILAVCRWRSVARVLPLLAVLLIALALRASHAAWGLPGLLHPDEHRYIGPAVIIVARGDLNPHYFENPSLMIYVTSLLFWGLTEHSIAFHALDEFFNLGIPDPRGDFLQMVALRGLVAAAGTGTVLAVYLAGRELFGRRAGLFGALFLAVSFLHVRNSHYATNDILAVFFLSLGFLFSARIYTRGRPADYLLAGLLGGLAASTKYNVGVFAVAVVVAHLGRVTAPGGLPERQPPRHQGTKRRPVESLVSWCLGGWRKSWEGIWLLPVAALASLVAFLAGTPYALLDPHSFLADFRSQLGYGAQPWRGQVEGIPALAFPAALAQGFGLAPLVLAGLGAALAARRHGWRAATILATPLIYYLFMATQHLFFARFALPTLPFLAILAGYAVDRLAPAPVSIGVASGGWRRAVPLLVLVVALAQPLALTLRHDLLLGRADTRLLAAAWIDAHLPAEASLAMEGYAQPDSKFWWKGHGVRDTWVYWPERVESLERAMSGEFRYVVASSFGYGPWQDPDDPPSLLPPGYDPLETQGRLLAVFGPGPSGSDLPFALDDMYTPFWHLFDRERPGPAVRIYEMR